MLKEPEAEWVSSYTQKHQSGDVLLGAEPARYALDKGDQKPTLGIENHHPLTHPIRQSIDITFPDTS
jgi:hypothetical protein